MHNTIQICSNYFILKIVSKNVGYCLDIQRFNEQDTWSIVLDSTNLSVLGHVVCVGEVSLEDDLGLARRLAKLVQHVQLVRAVLADVGGQHVLFRHLCTDSTINTGLLFIPFEKKTNYQDFKISVGLPYLILRRDYESLTNIFHRVIHKFI